MMLEELNQLIDYVAKPDASKDGYAEAITQDNCLGKRSAKSRTLTYRHLVELYMGILKGLLVF